MSNVISAVEKLFESGKKFSVRLTIVVFVKECFHGEIFYSLKEAQVLEQWREEYNTRRPHSALGYRPPAPGGL